MKNLKLHPNYIITSFSRCSEYNVYNRITWNNSKYYNINALVSTFKGEVTFKTDLFYQSLLLYKIPKFFIVFVFPDSEISICNDYITLHEYIGNAMAFNISCITFSVFLNKMKSDYCIRVPNCTLVIFRGMNWSDIVNPLAKEKFVVTGGFTSKRHISSSLSHQHHAYILAMFNFDLVALNKCINFDGVNPNHLFPRESLTRNRRSNVKIRDDGVFIKENREASLYFNNKNDISVQKKGYHTLKNNSVKFYSTVNNDSKYELNKYVYAQLETIFKNNPINSETQILIENFLFNQFKQLLQNKTNQILGVDTKVLNRKFSKYCVSKS